VNNPANTGIHCCQVQPVMAKGQETSWQTRLSTMNMFNMGFNTGLVPSGCGELLKKALNWVAGFLSTKL
jgi:hypothetical protein